MRIEKIALAVVEYIEVLEPFGDTAYGEKTLYRRFKKGEWEIQLEDGFWDSIGAQLVIERLEEMYQEYRKRTVKETELIGGRHDWEIVRPFGESRIHKKEAI